jgi:hypothetical protein
MLTLLKNDLEDNLMNLKNENFELRTQSIGKDEKLRKYEINLSQMETQLNELQTVSFFFLLFPHDAMVTDICILYFYVNQKYDHQAKELQMEKRNYLKKCQDNEDLFKALKFSEEKVNNYDLKLSDKDELIASYKAKLSKTESDLARTDYEYKRLRSKYL